MNSTHKGLCLALAAALILALVLALPLPVSLSLAGTWALPRPLAWPLFASRRRPATARLGALLIA